MSRVARPYFVFGRGILGSALNLLAQMLGVGPAMTSLESENIVSPALYGDFQGVLYVKKP